MFASLGQVNHGWLLAPWGGQRPDAIERQTSPKWHLFDLICTAISKEGQYPLGSRSMYAILVEVKLLSNVTYIKCTTNYRTNICSKCTISCVCRRWGLYFAFRSPYLCGVTSVTWVTMGTCGITCGVHNIRRHHVFRLGFLIGLRSVSRFGWRDVCELMVRSGSWAI